MFMLCFSFVILKHLQDIDNFQNSSEVPILATLTPSLNPYLMLSRMAIQAYLIVS